MQATTTPRAVIEAAIRAMRVAGQDDATARRMAEKSSRYDARGSGKTARMVCVRALVKTPRGLGPLIEQLVERLPSTAPTGNPLQARLRAYVAQVYVEVIESRGGETAIEEKDRTVHLYVAARAGGLTLLRAEGWRQYSRAFGARKATLAYLCGRDDNGRWAVRVPGTCRSVSDALEFVEPAAVKKARAAGRRVLRQGDVYAIETTKPHDGTGGLPSNHRWDAATRTLCHLDPAAPHGALHVPFPARFVTQSTLRMGRTTGRRRGD